MTRGDGGLAFGLSDVNRSAPGMSLRVYLANRAPISRRFVEEVWGGTVDLTKDSDRAAFIAVWVSLCYEWADEMLQQKELEKEEVA